MTDEKKPSADAQKTYKTGGYNKPTRERGYSAPVEILPSPDVLESYNYVVAGSAEAILKMFDYEQLHRHDMERQMLRMQSFSALFGQILGFLVAIAAFASATMLGIYGSETLAAIIWVFAAALMVLAGLVWAYVKQVGQRALVDRTIFNSDSQNT